MAEKIKIKRSEKYALIAAAVGFAVGIPMAMVAGVFGIILGALVAGGLYQAMLKQAALTRAVDAKILDN